MEPARTEPWSRVGLRQRVCSRGLGHAEGCSAQACSAQRCLHNRTLKWQSSHLRRRGCFWSRLRGLTACSPEPWLGRFGEAALHIPGLLPEARVPGRISLCRVQAQLVAEVLSSTACVQGMSLMENLKGRKWLRLAAAEAFTEGVRYATRRGSGGPSVHGT